MRRALILMMMVGAPAMAADGPWTPAPVPSIGAPRVQPAARAGTDGPAVVDTPFSSVPQGSIAANGGTSSDLVDGAKTPNLSGK